MPIATDSRIRASLKSLLNTIAPTSRVVPRWILDFKKEDWAGVVRGLAENGKVDGWLITRTAMRSKQTGLNHWSYEWDYDLWYFKSYALGTATANSEYELNAMLETAITTFELNETLGFNAETDGVDKHNGLQVRNIDLVDNQVHTVMANLTVFLTKQN
jgi:hypothetical protein